MTSSRVQNVFKLILWALDSGSVLIPRVIATLTQAIDRRGDTLSAVGHMLQLVTGLLVL